jgi:TM2 domain-containing membrane protein YozV
MASPETSPMPVCVRCHRPIPEGQRLQHRGETYCLDCVGKSLNGEASPEHARRRSPGVAVLLSLLPGLGQMYNGQMLKGVIVLVAFLILATGGGPLGWDHSGLNTAFLVTLYFWNLFDAHWTAQRINRAELPQLPEAPQAPPSAARQAPSPVAPAWGVLLIVLGVLFLLNNFGATWLTWDRVWPMALLALGIWLLTSFALSRRVTLPPQSEPPSQPPWAASVSSAPTAPPQGMPGAHAVSQVPPARERTAVQPEPKPTSPPEPDAVSQVPPAHEQTAVQPEPEAPSPPEPAAPESPSEEVNHG